MHEAEQVNDQEEELCYHLELGVGYLAVVAEVEVGEFAKLKNIVEVLELLHYYLVIIYDHHSVFKIFIIIYFILSSLATRFLIFVLLSIFYNNLYSNSTFSYGLNNYTQNSSMSTSFPFSSSRTTNTSFSSIPCNLSKYRMLGYLWFSRVGALETGKLVMYLLN